MIGGGTEAATAPKQQVFSTAEMELLLCCGRTSFDRAHQQQVKELLAGRVDWSILAENAIRHKLVPLLASNLSGYGDLIPAEVQQQLRFAFSENAHEVLRHCAQLFHLLGRWAEVGVQAVPYKGPVLGAQLYGNVALRQAGDLDVLVDRRDVTAAREVLFDQGYRARHSVSAQSAVFMIRSRYSEVFDRDGGPTVELHWAFTNGDIGLRLELEQLRPNLETTLVGGTAMPVFGREDLLLILCIHGSKHRWDRLEWLVGLAEAVRTAAAVDWGRLVRRATLLGTRRMLLLGLLLAHELLHAPVPYEVLGEARLDRAVRRLARKVPALLEEGSGADEEVGSLPVDLFRVQLRERARDRLRFLFYRMTTPSRPEDWAGISIGSVFMPLHGFFRPAKLLSKVVPAVRSIHRSMARSAEGH